jgi:hypothetical protein
MLPNSDMLTFLSRGVVKSSAVALFCREPRAMLTLSLFEPSFLQQHGEQHWLDEPTETSDDDEDHVSLVFDCANKRTDNLAAIKGVKIDNAEQPVAVANAQWYKPYIRSRIM